MTRDELIRAATRYELNWYRSNCTGNEDDCEDDIVNFFADGGFLSYSDERLRKFYELHIGTEV